MCTDGPVPALLNCGVPQRAAPEHPGSERTSGRDGDRLPVLRVALAAGRNGHGWGSWSVARAPGRPRGLAWAPGRDNASASRSRRGSRAPGLAGRMSARRDVPRQVCARRGAGVSATSGGGGVQLGPRGDSAPRHTRASDSAGGTRNFQVGTRPPGAAGCGAHGAPEAGGAWRRDPAGAGGATCPGRPVPGAKCPPGGCGGGAATWEGGAGPAHRPRPAVPAPRGGSPRTPRWRAPTEEVIGVYPRARGRSPLDLFFSFLRSRTLQMFRPMPTIQRGDGVHPL